MQQQWPKSCLYAAGVAFCLAVVPDFALGHFGGESPFWFVFGIWMLPGAFVGMVIAGGRIHDIDFQVVEAANFAIYFGIAYFFLTVWQRRKRKGVAGS